MYRMARNLGAVLAAAAAVVAVPAAAYAAGPAHTAVAGERFARPATTPASVTRLIGSGAFADGTSWSVSLQYYPTAPASFVKEDGAVPAGDGVLCQHMYIGGVLIDHQAGTWADCDAADPDDPQSDEGLWGFTDEGTSGDRLFVAQPPASVTRAVFGFQDHDTRSTNTVSLPGTPFTAYVMPISTGETIFSIDEYNAAGQLVDTDTDFH